MNLLLLTEGLTNNYVLDSSVLDFIVEGAEKVLGIMATPPLGTFLTIGITGAVVGLVGTIIAIVKH